MSAYALPTQNPYWETPPDADWRCTMPDCMEGNEDNVVAGLCPRHVAEHVHDEPLSATARIEGQRVVIELDAIAFDMDRALAVMRWATEQGIKPTVGVLIDAWTQAEQRGIA